MQNPLPESFLIVNSLQGQFDLAKKKKKKKNKGKKI